MHTFKQEMMVILFYKINNNFAAKENKNEKTKVNYAKHISISPKKKKKIEIDCTNGINHIEILYYCAHLIYIYIYIDTL